MSLSFPQSQKPHQFHHSSDGSDVTAQFTPVLRLYITSAYQEGDIIRTEVASPMIWSQNLATLQGGEAQFVLSRDRQGLFKVAAACIGKLSTALEGTSVRCDAHSVIT